MKNKKKLIVITGPTGIGKTAISLYLNEAYNTSIISADSRQIYKELTIGTAKPTPEEIASGNIKFVDFLSVTEDYNAGQFEKDAMIIITEDHYRSDVSIVCGGTGLYIKALTEGLDQFPNIPIEQVAQLETELSEAGIESLQNRLKEKDPEQYANMDIDNPHRLIRALSIIDYTGQAYSSFLGQDKVERPFEIINIVIDTEREIIYNRIEKRVDQMIEAGLIDEVKSMMAYRNLNALNTVGYKEVFAHLDGDYTLSTCVAEIKKNTRRYAKRQLTWLRKYNLGQRFLPSNIDKIKKYIDQRLLA